MAQSRYDDKKDQLLAAFLDLDIFESVREMFDDGRAECNDVLDCENSK